LTTEGVDVNQRRVMREALSRGGETVTVPTRKIPATAIEQVRRAVQDAPECLAKEVTKVQAIRALIPDIRKMQSKGYDWKAIASLLSEQGIAVTVVTLKSYLQQAKARRVKRAQRKDGRIKTLARNAARGAHNRSDQGAVDTARGAATRADGRVLAAPPAGIAKQPSGDALKTSRPPDQDSDARRSAFVPEEDRDDI
jgi:hypothetical protein